MEIETKRCARCKDRFGRPEGMSDYHWGKRETCGTRSCISKTRSKSGKKGGAASSKKAKSIPFVAAQDYDIAVKPHDKTWDPLQKFAGHELKIAWLFR